MLVRDGPHVPMALKLFTKVGTGQCADLKGFL